MKADHIIVATHFPFLNKHDLYFLKMYRDRSYVLALKGVQHVDGMYIDENDNGLSFRWANDLLLLGGGTHRTGGKGGGLGVLKKEARRYYPNAKIVNHWATQDCITLDGIPYIGKYSRRTNGLYVATGFGKWSMTSSMAAASLLCDLILDKHNPYAEVFPPLAAYSIPSSPRMP